MSVKRKIKKTIKKTAIAVTKPFPPARRAVRHALWSHRSKIYQQVKAKTPTEPKTIIFESFMGRSYSDNPRAIYEQMLHDRRFDDYKFIWAFKRSQIAVAASNPMMLRATIVQAGTNAYYRAYARAGTWISNSRLPEQLQPTDDQRYIQTWHGTPLKRLGYDIEVEGENAMNTKQDILEKYDDDAKRYYAMVSPSKFVTNRYKSAFNLTKNNPHCKIWQTGYPRNDKLALAKADDIDNLKNKLGIPSNKKVILYAPTWRDNQHSSNVGYTYQNELDFDYLQRTLGDKYVILFRAHYFVANSFDFDKYNGFVLDASKISNINGLYIISDMLITDYSSVFFDYSILRRPIIFYMYDLDEYRDDVRGFYIPLNKLPGPITTNIGDLIKHIKNPPKVGKAYETFVQKYAPLDDGEASKRVVDKIIREELK